MPSDKTQKFKDCQLKVKFCVFLEELHKLKEKITKSQLQIFLRNLQQALLAHLNFQLSFLRTHFVRFVYLIFGI